VSEAILSGPLVYATLAAMVCDWPRQPMAASEIAAVRP
jgi:hypothetical protein